MTNFNGFILVDKEADCTSFDVVAKIRNLTKAKVGHCGTLDPFATGLLPIAVGNATRLTEYLLHETKEYEFTLSYGESTDSYDLTGEVTASSKKLPSEEAVQKASKKFVGKISQVPPIFSALKINGKKAYEYARKGEKVKMKARDIEIYTLKLLWHESGETRFYVKCSKGTYIRSLARDICKALKLEGHVSALRRVAVGDIKLENVVSCSLIFNSINADFLVPYVIDSNKLINSLAEYEVDQNTWEKLAVGTKLLINNLPFSEGEIIKVKLDEKLVSIAIYEDKYLKPKKNLY